MNPKADAWRSRKGDDTYGLENINIQQDHKTYQEPPESGIAHS
jgi:hypothetical protein